MQVEVKDKKADRFRAYCKVKLLRSPTAEDHIARDRAGKPPLPLRSKIRFDGEDPLIEGDVSGPGVTISVPKGKQITRVVFYKGPIETEQVVGSIDDVEVLDGTIEIEFIDPVDPTSVFVVDEDE